MFWLFCFLTRAGRVEIPLEALSHLVSSVCRLYAFHSFLLSPQLGSFEVVSINIMYTYTIHT